MSDGSLVFRAPALQPGQSPDLVFGLDTAVPLPPATLTISARLPGMRVSGYLRGGVRLSIAARMPGMRASVTLAWDANVSRSTTHQVRSLWQAGTPVRASTVARWQDAARTRIETKTRWQTGLPVRAAAVERWKESAHLRAATAARWQQGRPLRDVAAMLWQESLHLRVAAAEQWQDGVPLRGVVGTQWQESIHLRGTAKTAWQEARHVQVSAREQAGAGQPLRIVLATAWQKARKPPIGVSYVVPVVPPAHLCYDPETIADLVFRDAWTGSADLIFICRGHGPDPEPEPARYVIPLLRIYMSVHHITTVLLPSLEPVRLLDATISADDDGYAWQLSASGPEHLMDQLAPSSGLPARVKISVDGMDWIFAIESVGRSRSIAGYRTQITGRSVTSLLGDPYMGATNWLNAEARTAQQLATEALQFTGTDIDWQLTDWLVPAGAWSHQGTPLSAALRLAEAVGGVLRSHPTDPTLIFAPRYPTLPWEWAATTPDVQMPLAVITTDSYQPAYRPQWNAVYVSGQTQGVLGLVRRYGTAGDVLAPMVTDALITHSDAVRQRGSAVLGSGGRVVTQQITLPVMTGGTLPGLLRTGQLIEVQEPNANHWRGLVRSISLRVALPSGKRPSVSVRQSATLERHL